VLSLDDRVKVNLLIRVGLPICCCFNESILSDYLAFASVTARLVLA